MGTNRANTGEQKLTQEMTVANRSNGANRSKQWLTGANSGPLKLMAANPLNDDASQVVTLETNK